MVLRCFLIFSILLLGCQNDSPIVDFDEDEKEIGNTRGDKIFLKLCSNCHGLDGKLGNSGAKDLSVSKMTDAQITTILQEGKNAMPPMAELMEQTANMDSVIAFVKTLRK